MALSRIRAFSLVTYLSEKQLENVLSQYNYDINHYVYIVHNKDINQDGTLKEKHIHLILYTYNNHTPNAILKWFKGFKDKKGQYINTLIEPVINRNKALLYLTHKEDKDKYRYNSKSLKGHLVWYKSCLKLNNNNDDDSPNEKAFNLYVDISDGVDVHTLLKRYGFSFLNQYKNIKQIQREYDVNLLNCVKD